MSYQTIFNDQGFLQTRSLKEILKIYKKSPMDEKPQISDEVFTYYKNLYQNHDFTYDAARYMFLYYKSGMKEIFSLMADYLPTLLITLPLSLRSTLKAELYHLYQDQFSNEECQKMDRAMEAAGFTSSQIHLESKSLSPLKASCWYEVATIIYQHHYKVNIDPLKIQNYDIEQPIQSELQPFILKPLGFQAIYASIPYIVTPQNQIALLQKRNFTISQIQNDLNVYGPLYASGAFAEGLPHVICVIGTQWVDADQNGLITFQDPTYREEKYPGQKIFSMPIAAFNEQIAQTSTPALWYLNKDKHIALA